MKYNLILKNRGEQSKTNNFGEILGGLGLVVPPLLDGVIRIDSVYFFLSANFLSMWEVDTPLKNELGDSG